MVAYERVELARQLWIKGNSFSISQLLQSQDLAIPFQNGAVASFRLSPQDYHRYHSPVQGKVKWWKSIPGDYYLVDPWCVRSKVNVLGMNDRSAVCLETKEFGDVLFVAIGASEVGTVK
jgi:phosphatidylserine decarboxylase